MIRESDLAVKLCEILPYNLTIFAKDGRCQIVDHNCPYQITNSSRDLIVCRKETTTTLPLDNYVI